MVTTWLAHRQRHIADYCRFYREPLRPGYDDPRQGHERVNGKKKEKRTAALSKLDKTLPCLIFICALIYFVFYYKSFASTDIATNQMRIHITLKICNTRNNWYFLHWLTLHRFPPHIMQHWYFLDKLKYLAFLWTRYTCNSTEFTLKLILSY